MANQLTMDMVQNIRDPQSKGFSQRRIAWELGLYRETMQLYRTGEDKGVAPKYGAP